MRNIKSFDEWYEKNQEELINEYIEMHPENFRTEEDYIEIENMYAFQEFCENRYQETLTLNTSKVNE